MEFVISAKSQLKAEVKIKIGWLLIIIIQLAKLEGFFALIAIQRWGYLGIVEYYYNQQ